MMFIYFAIASMVSASGFIPSPDKEIPVEIAVTNSIFNLLNHSVYDLVKDRLSESASLFSVMYKSYYNGDEWTPAETAKFTAELKAVGFKLDTFATIPSIVRYLLRSIGIKSEVISIREAELGGLGALVDALDFDATDFVLVSIKEIVAHGPPPLVFSQPDRPTMFTVLSGTSDAASDKIEYPKRLVLLYGKKLKPDVPRECVSAAIRVIYSLNVLPENGSVEAPPAFPLALYRRIGLGYGIDLNFAEMDNEVRFLATKMPLGSFDDVPNLVKYYMQLLGLRVGSVDAPGGAKHLIRLFRPRRMEEYPSSVRGFTRVFQVDNEPFMDGVLAAILVYEADPPVACEVTWSAMQMLSRIFLIWSKMRDTPNQDDELTLFNKVYLETTQVYGNLLQCSSDCEALAAQLETRGHKMNTFAAIPEILRERLVHFGTVSEIPIISTSEASMKAKIANTTIKPSTQYVIVSVHSVVSDVVPYVGLGFLLVSRTDNNHLVEDEPERKRAIFLFERT